MTLQALTLTRPVLADRLPRGRAADVVLVVAAAACTSLAAQIAVPVPGSPVPVTGQTFAVLLSAAALGPLRGVLAELLYVAAGIAGLPVYSHGSHGYHALLGATGGYLAGFVLAALLVGAAARAGFDRRPVTVVSVFLLGSAVIYLPGVGWLAHQAHLSAATAIREGVTPYLVGDLAKALAAAVLLPTAWRAVCNVRRDPPTQRPAASILVLPNNMVKKNYDTDPA